MDNQVRQHMIKIAERLCENAAKIRYGTVSTTLRIHDARVVDIIYTTTENKREQERVK